MAEKQATKAQDRAERAGRKPPERKGSERKTPEPRKAPGKRPARRLPAEARVRWKGWLVVSVLAAVALLGGVVLLEGAGFFRDIERAETLIVAGWVGVAAVSIFITVAVGLARKK